MPIFDSPKLLALASLASLALLASCDGPADGWVHEAILDEIQLDESNPTSDYEFRICKDGDATQEQASGEIRIRGTAPQGADTGSSAMVVSQWRTKADYDAGDEPNEVARGLVGDRIVGEIEARGSFSESGEHCGPWSVFRIELEQPGQDVAVGLSGSLEVEFFHDDAPLRDMFVEMPHH